MENEREAMLRRAADGLNKRWEDSRRRFDAWVAAGGSVYGGKPAPCFAMWPGGFTPDERIIE